MARTRQISHHLDIAVAAAILSLAFATMTPAAAFADPGRLYVSSDGSLHCTNFSRSCATAAACDPLQHCGAIGVGGARAYCHDGELSFLCCSDDADCLLTDDETGDSYSGLCMPVNSAVDLGGGDAVCVFEIAGTARTFCTLEDPVAMAACLQNGAGPGGTPVSRWGSGNCDQDALNNGPELIAGCDPCDATESSPPCTGGLVDAGPGEADAGRRDSGVVTADAGGLRDAASVRDGAARDAFAGRDTGASDFVDSAVAPPTGEVEFRGTGGCACSSAAGMLHPDRGRGAAAALAFLAALVGLRRRRGTSRGSSRSSV